MTDRIWMAVTPDKYELPIAIANTEAELAGILGVTPGAIAHKRNNKCSSCYKYKIVVVEGGD